MRALACLSLLALALPASAADAKFDPAGRARALAPLIEDETFALIRIDFTRADVEGLSKTLLPLLPSRKDELPALARQIKVFQAAFTQVGGTELIVSLSTEDVPAISFIYIPLKDEEDAPALTELLKPHLPHGAVVQKRGSALVVGASESLARFARGKPSTRTDLNAAVKAAGDTAVQVLLLPTADQRRVIDEAVALPVRGASAKVLTRGVRWAALGLDVGAKPRAELTLQSADATAARKLADLIEAGVGLAGGMKFFGEDAPLKTLHPKDFATAARALKPKVAGSQVTLAVSAPDAVRALAVFADAFGERIELSASSENLRRILIAMHNYHDSNAAFPAHAVYSKAGKPLLSWRVALLPYLDESHLYKQFKLDEPWDSAHNKKLIARMPKVYRDPKLKDRRPGMTTYLALINKAFVFTGTKEGTPIKEITDGTSNTAMVVDVHDEAGVVWTKPDDFVVHEKDPWKGLRGHYPGFVLAGMADGSVQRIPKTAKAGTIWALFTRAGGEVVPDLSK